MRDVPPEFAEAPAYPCPACGSVVPASCAAILRCPACDTQFFRPEPEESEAAGSGEASDEHAAALARESELSGFRIQQVSVGRRSAYRARSYCVVAAAACLVAVVKLVLMTAPLLRHGLGNGRPGLLGLYGALGLAAAYGAFHFARRAIDLTLEAQASRLEDPETPPDFSPLGDGSHYARNLEAFGSGSPAARHGREDS